MPKYETLNDKLPVVRLKDGQKEQFYKILEEKKINYSEFIRSTVDQYIKANTPHTK